MGPWAHVVKGSCQSVVVGDLAAIGSLHVWLNLHSLACLPVGRYHALSWQNAGFSIVRIIMTLNGQ